MNDMIEDEEFTCPQCGSSQFGSSGIPDSVGWEGHCHGVVDVPNSACGRSCGFTWLRSDDAKYFKKLGTFRPRFAGGQQIVHVEPKNKAEFIARWTVECAEWDAIGRELMDQQATVVASDISEEQRRRMAARGERSVIDTAFARKYVLNQPDLRRVK